MTDQPAKPPEDGDPPIVNSVATDTALADAPTALARIDALKRGTIEIRDALQAAIAAHRDPSSPTGQYWAHAREKFTEFERDAQRRQLRTNIWKFCAALIQLVGFMSMLLSIVIMSSVMLWSTT